MQGLASVMSSLQLGGKVSSHLLSSIITPSRQQKLECRMMNDSTDADGDVDLNDTHSSSIKRNNEDRPDLCRQCANVDLDSIASGQSSKRYQVSHLVANRETCQLCDFILCCLEGRGAPTATCDTKEDRRRVLLHHTISDTRPDLGALRIILQDSHISYATDISGSSGFAKGRPLIPVTIPSTHCIDFNRVRDWIAKCQLTHGDACLDRVRVDAKAIRAFQNFRVIDCDARTVVPWPEGCNYAALSYVWGAAGATKQSPNQRLSENSSSSKESLSLPHYIPKTVEDALEVVLHLGMKYLWVDKYCIDQTNPLEMHAQLSAMDVIYETARLTIVAAAGDAFSGLPGVTTTPRNARPIIHDEVNSWVELVEGWDKVERSLWSSRAWTYQEGLCAVRKLVFTDEQILFECDVAGARETDGLEMDLRSSHQSQKGLALLNCTLADHISQYSRRQLSFQSDALNAMRGIFERFSHLANPTLQYWGIPTNAAAYGGVSQMHLNIQDWFLLGLLWLLDGESCTQRRPEFPSWSWAGWRAPVIWPSWTGLQNHSPERLTIRVHEEEHFEEDLTESTIRRSNSARHVQLSRTPPVLRIRASVRRFTPEFNEGVIKMLIHSSATHAILISHPLDVEDQWELRLTAHVEKGNEAWHALRFETLLCIIVSQQYALVVSGDGKVKTKIGVLVRQSELSPHISRGHAPVPEMDSRNKLCFADAMSPAEEETVLLG